MCGLWYKILGGIAGQNLANYQLAYFLANRNGDPHSIDGTARLHPALRLHKADNMVGPCVQFLHRGLHHITLLHRKQSDQPYRHRLQLAEVFLILAHLHLEL